ncbi:MAG TPA: hypothetical protein VJX67_27565 [Blastocatellia bacterium]|nr:hypothetical protein [Blastocatellia bacterium]
MKKIRALAAPALLVVIGLWAAHPGFQAARAASDRPASGEGQQATAAYFKQQEKCGELLVAHRFVDAEQTCNELIDLTDKLPSSYQNERRVAYQLSGHAFFYERKFVDALGMYRREFAVAQGYLKPYDAELGDAYYDVAQGLHQTNNFPEAKLNYERAESTYELARERNLSASLQIDLTTRMKSVLRVYALLLRQMGDKSGADAAEKKERSLELNPAHPRQ